MASGQDLLRYLTTRAVEYLESPRQERTKRKKAAEPWSYRLFGWLPLSIGMWRAEQQKRYRDATEKYKKLWKIRSNIMSKR